MDTGIVLGRASSVSSVHLDGFMTTGPRQGRMQSERQPVPPNASGYAYGAPVQLPHCLSPCLYHLHGMRLGTTCMGRWDVVII